MVSAIIVNYRAGKILTHCLDSIKEQVDEIIIVNHSPDEDLNPLTQKFPNTKIINRPNKGYASGCNFGAKIAKGDLLLFMNPDTMAFPNTINILKETTKKYCSATAPKYLNPDFTFQPSTRMFPSLKHILVSRTSPLRVFFKSSKIEKEYFGYTLRDQENPLPLKECFPLGGFFMIPRPIFESLEGFDERFFLFFEDADFFKRLLKSGYSIIYEPRAKIIHFHGFSRKSSAFKSEFHKLRSFFLYTKKHSLNQFEKIFVLLLTLTYGLIVAFHYFINIPIKESQW
uniref:Glycosyltransferase family 2 protein n=1 Tax=candidate division WOR-3 bacterium TaxID=2052148 RepID=A0A7V3ZZM8_UNCW3